MEACICQNCPDPSVQAIICSKAEIFMHRLLNHAVADQLTGPVPTAASPQPRPQHPPCGDLMQALLHGSAMTLTELPPALATTAMVPAPPRAAGPAETRNPGNDGRQAPAPGSNIRVNAPPNQNPRLKAAWTALGAPSLYGPGAPFHDPNQRNGRKQIMRLSGNRSQRICPAMACKGFCYSNCTGYHGPLTNPEEQLVAREGGMTLANE